MLTLSPRSNGPFTLTTPAGSSERPASQRRHGARIDVRGRLAREPCENPALAAFHPRAIRRKPRADRLPFDGPYKDIVGRSARHQYGHPRFGREPGGLQLRQHAAGAARRARARRQRQNLVGNDAAPRAISVADDVPPRIGGVQALLIGQQNQQVGIDQVRHERRQIVVVADLDFLGRDDVVFVDDRDDLALEQREQRVARVQVALAVGQIARASAASARR